jgi:hypothetical protein
MTGEVLGRQRPVQSATPSSSAGQPDLDTVYQELLAGKPEDFYEQAGQIDRILDQMADGAGQFGNHSRNLEEVWKGAGWAGYSAAMDWLSSHLDQLTQSLRTPGYGSLLRQTGDVLASGQRRIRDLKSQRDQQAAGDPAGAATDAHRYDYLAQQIMQDVRSSYVRIGGQFAHLPDYTSQGNRTWSAGNPPPPEVTDPSVVWSGTAVDPGGSPVATEPGNFHFTSIGPGPAVFTGPALGRNMSISDVHRFDRAVAGPDARDRDGGPLSERMPVNGVLGSPKLTATPTEKGEFGPSAGPPRETYSVRGGVLRSVETQSRQRDSHPAQGSDTHHSVETQSTQPIELDSYRAQGDTHHSVETQSTQRSGEVPAEQPSSETPAVAVVGGGGVPGTPPPPRPTRPPDGKKTSSSKDDGAKTTPANPATAVAPATPATPASHAPATQSATTTSGTVHLPVPPDPGTATGSATTAPADPAIHITGASTAPAVVQHSGATGAPSATPDPSSAHQVTLAGHTSTVDGAVHTSAQPADTAGGYSMSPSMMPAMAMNAAQLAAADRQRVAMFRADLGEWGPGSGLAGALGRPEPPSPPEPEPEPPEGQKNG